MNRFTNNNCDGSGPCKPGEVRLLPLGSSPHHGNIILCEYCFHREISCRQERNRKLAADCAFKLPLWTDCEIYGQEVTR